MTITLSKAALDIILGIVILIQPKFLAWIIAIWLILTGILELGILKF